MDDSEEAVEARIEGDSEEGGVGGERIVGEEGGGYAGVRDGDELAVTEGAHDEVIGLGVPREGLWIEIGPSEVDDVAIPAVNGAGEEN